MLKYKKFLLSLLFLNIIGMFFNVTSAYAITEPSFPSCINPQGTLKANYTSGTHGVPGDTKTYTGSDSVYKLTNSTLIQCLCPTDGNGIQTNWWKVSGMSENDINSLKNNGWIFIPNGSVWGLDNEPYLTKNLKYSCIGGIGGVSAQKNLGDVLGLASTGNVASVYFYLISGVTLLVLGLNLNTVISRE
jgi:hypothetical protein